MPEQPTAVAERLPHTCRCGARWAGSRTAHCAAECHRTFTTVGNFDRHRRDARCLHPADVGLVPTHRAGYVAYGQPASTSWQHRTAS